MTGTFTVVIDWPVRQIREFLIFCIFILYFYFVLLCVMLINPSINQSANQSINQVASRKHKCKSGISPLESISHLLVTAYTYQILFLFIKSCYKIIK